MNDKPKSDEPKGFFFPDDDVIAQFKNKASQINKPVTNDEVDLELISENPAGLTATFKRTLIGLGVTLVSGICNYLLLNADGLEGLLFIVGLATLGTFLLVPYLAGVVTFVFFILDFKKMNDQ